MYKIVTKSREIDLNFKVEFFTIVAEDVTERVTYLERVQKVDALYDTFIIRVKDLQISQTYAKNRFSNFIFTLNDEVTNLYIYDIKVVGKRETEVICKTDGVLLEEDYSGHLQFLEDETYSDAIGNILTEYSINFDISAFISVPLFDVSELGVSRAEFIKDFANLIGFEIYRRDSKLLFVPAQNIYSYTQTKEYIDDFFSITTTTEDEAKVGKVYINCRPEEPIYSEPLITLAIDPSPQPLSPTTVKTYEDNDFIYKIRPITATARIYYSPILGDIKPDIVGLSGTFRENYKVVEKFILNNERYITVAGGIKKIIDIFYSEDDTEDNQLAELDIPAFYRGTNTDLIFQSDLLAEDLSLGNNIKVELVDTDTDRDIGSEIAGNGTDADPYIYKLFLGNRVNIPRSYPTFNLEIDAKDLKFDLFSNDNFEIYSYDFKFILKKYENIIKEVKFLTEFYNGERTIVQRDDEIIFYFGELDEYVTNLELKVDAKDCYNNNILRFDMFFADFDNKIAKGKDVLFRVEKYSEDKEFALVEEDTALIFYIGEYPDDNIFYCDSNMSVEIYMEYEVFRDRIKKIAQESEVSLYPLNYFKDLEREYKDIYGEELKYVDFINLEQAETTKTKGAIRYESFFYHLKEMINNCEDIECINFAEMERKYEKITAFNSLRQMNNAVTFGGRVGAYYGQNDNRAIANYVNTDPLAGNILKVIDNQDEQTPTNQKSYPQSPLEGGFGKRAQILSNFEYQYGYNTVVFNSLLTGVVKIAYETDIFFAQIPPYEREFLKPIKATHYNQLLTYNHELKATDYFPKPFKKVLNLITDWNIDPNDAIYCQGDILQGDTVIKEWEANAFGELDIVFEDYGVYHLSSKVGSYEDLYIEYFVNRFNISLNQPRS